MISDTHKKVIHDRAYARECAMKVLEDGYCVCRNFLNEHSYEYLLKEIKEKELQNKKGRELEGTLVWDLGISSEMLAFFDALHHARCEIEEKEYEALRMERQRVGLPYKNGKEKNKVETPFHFDGAYVNAVLALTLPEDGKGDLFIYPNLRTRFGEGVFGKVIARVLRHSKALRMVWKPKQIAYEENALTIFFGDRTLHGVAPLSGGERLVMTINNHW